MLYDGFLFFNELDLLEIRLQYLSPIVDRFVLVESTKTFSGLKKDLIFQQNQERYKPYLSKIDYVLVDDPVSPDPWKNERHQRDCITRGLKNCKPDDIIMISDCDEIPSLEAIQAYTPKNQVWGFQQQMFYYYFNTSINVAWCGTKIFPYKIMPNPLNSIRDIYCGDGALTNPGGWHFSFLGTENQIRDKVQAFSHQEMNRPEVIKDIENNRQALKDLFFRPDISFQKVSLDFTFPWPILANPKKYSHLIAP